MAVEPVPQLVGFELQVVVSHEDRPLRFGVGHGSSEKRPEHGRQVMEQGVAVRGRGVFCSGLDFT